MPRGDGTGPGGAGAGKGKKMGTCGFGNQSNLKKGIGQIDSSYANSTQRKELNKKQGQGSNRGNGGFGKRGSI